jgi:hypothetical protein
VEESRHVKFNDIMLIFWRSAENTKSYQENLCPSRILYPVPLEFK